MTSTIYDIREIVCQRKTTLDDLWWLNRDVNKQIGKSQSTGQEIMNAKFVNQAPNIELLGVRQSVAAPCLEEYRKLILMQKNF